MAINSRSLKTTLSSPCCSKCWLLMASTRVNKRWVTRMPPLGRKANLTTQCWTNRCTLWSRRSNASLTRSGRREKMRLTSSKVSLRKRTKHSAALSASGGTAQWQVVSQSNRVTSIWQWWDSTFKETETSKSRKWRNSVSSLISSWRPNLLWSSSKLRQCLLSNSRLISRKYLARSSEDKDLHRLERMVMQPIR